MIEALKTLPRFLMRKTGLYSSYYLRTYGYLREMNWFRSYDTLQIIGPNNEPLPWITYPTIHFLESRLRSDMSVFEFGSGNSTFWWAKRVAQVDTVEHLKEWYDKLLPSLPDNVNLHLVELERGGEYCRTPTRLDKQFDLVMIDGRDRVNCAKQSLSALKDDGVIVWDNTDRAKYREGFEFLHYEGFRQIDFFGLGPRCVEGWPTSVFYRANNCLGNLSSSSD